MLSNEALFSLQSIGIRAVRDEEVNTRLKLLRNHVTASTTTLRDSETRIKARKLQDLGLLSLLLLVLDDEVLEFSLREALRSQAQKVLSEEDFCLYETIFLNRDKHLVELWLLEQNLFGNHDFFGVFTLKNLRNLILRFWKLPLPRPRPRNSQRVRGYRDHGSRKLGHEVHSFVPDDAGYQQWKVEEHRRALQDTALLIKGFIT